MITMVLSSRNSGKYLSAEWARDREEAARDSSRFTADELTYLEVGSGYAAKGDGDAIEETMKIDTTPIDPNTPAQKNAVDVRDRYAAGGTGYL